MKVPQTMPDTFNKPVGHSMPFEKDCKNQLAPEHPVQKSVESVSLHESTLEISLNNHSKPFLV